MNKDMIAEEIITDYLDLIVVPHKEQKHLQR